MNFLNFFKSGKVQWLILISIGLTYSFDFLYNDFIPRSIQPYLFYIELIEFVLLMIIIFVPKK